MSHQVNSRSKDSDLLTWSWASYRKVQALGSELCLAGKFSGDLPDFQMHGISSELLQQRGMNGQDEGWVSARHRGNLLE